MLLSIRRSNTEDVHGSRRSQRLRALRGKPGLYLGIVLVGLFVLLGLLGPLFLSNPNAMSMYILSPPGVHGLLLGSDQYGRNEFTRIIWGIRTSLGIIVASIGISAFAGTVLGLLAARVHLFDEIVMRIMDVLMAFPAILLAIGIMAVAGTGVRSVIEAIAIVYLPIFTRVSRSAALEQMTKQYVESSEVVGSSMMRVLFRNVLPNSLSPIVVQISLALSDALLIEAALSYLGLGVAPPTASLGDMLRTGQSLMFTAPWTAIYPGVAIMWAVLGFNLLGDAIRDALAIRR